MLGNEEEQILQGSNVCGEGDTTLVRLTGVRSRWGISVVCLMEKDELGEPPIILYAEARSWTGGMGKIKTLFHTFLADEIFSIKFVGRDTQNIFMFLLDYATALLK